jgi:hypothetical protein
MRRPRLRQTRPDPSAPPEVAAEEESLRLAILSALPELRLPALRALLRAVRYAEEGADVVVLRLSDLRDANRRTLLLSIYEQNDGDPPGRPPSASPSGGR